MPLKPSVIDFTPRKNSNFPGSNIASERTPLLHQAPPEVEDDNFLHHYPKPQDPATPALSNSGLGMSAHRELLKSCVLDNDTEAMEFIENGCSPWSSKKKGDQVAPTRCSDIQPVKRKRRKCAIRCLDSRFAPV